MTDLRTLHPLVWLCSAAALLSVGCQQEQPPAVVAEAPEPTPEERFNALVEAIKHQHDTQSNDAAFDEEGKIDPATPITSSRASIEHLYLATGGAEGRPKGVVTIHTQASATVLLPLSDPDEDEPEPLGDSAAATSEAEGPDLALAKEDALKRLRISPIQTVETEHVREIVFEYVEGKWELITKLDKENEPFTAMAVEYALLRQ